MKHTCNCNACVYKRWWNRQQTRRRAGMKTEERPRPQNQPAGECSCSNCRIGRLKSARQRARRATARNAELREQIKDLRSTIEYLKTKRTA